MKKEVTYKQNEFKITLDDGSVFFEKSRREFNDMMSDLNTAQFINIGYRVFNCMSIRMIEESKTNKFGTHENFKEDYENKK